MDENKNEEIDYKEVAAQLRKPDGEFGKIVAEKMYEGNRVITDLTYNSVSKFPGDKILEIGFGNGAFLPKLLNNGHKKVYGIDYSQLMLNEANKIVGNFIIENKIELKFAAADSIPYPDNFFDKICTINTIYFWDEPGKIISEIKRVLKKDGIISIGFRSKERVKDLEFTRYNFILYSIDEVEKLFKDNGFKLVETISEDEEIYDAIAITFMKE